MPDDENLESKDFEEDEELDDESEEVANGIVCASCYGEFEQQQGTPSLCPDCWNASTEGERERYDKASCGIL